MRVFNPPHIAPPAATYNHDVEISPNARWLYVAGQVGMKPDGTIDAEMEGQAEQAWRNVLATLEGADMGIDHLVKVTSFLPRPQDVPAFTKVRDILVICVRPRPWWLCRRWLVQFISSRSRRLPRGTEPSPLQVGAISQHTALVSLPVRNEAAL